MATAAVARLEILARILVLGAIVSACGGESVDDGNGSGTLAESMERTPSGGFDNGSEPSASPLVKAQEVSSTWVFTVPPSDGYNEALFTGTANIVDGCLKVGESIVIWRETELSFAENAVAAVLAGETMVLRLGGSGNQVQDGETGEPGAPLPAPLGEFCSANSFWWASPEVSVDAATSDNE